MQEVKGYLNKLPGGIKDLIYLASDIAQKNNMRAYLVGGFVRDLLLQVKNLDLDIVVEADAIKFAEDFAHRLKGRLIRHKRFGTATVILRHNLKLDVATERKEVYPQPASLPVVTAGNLEDDLARRDFTINAMAISINKKDFGSLIDFFSGREDLRSKNIRILHNLSFIDDPTRIFRAIRFETKYNFKIASQTLLLLRKAVRAGMLIKLEPQRLRDGLILILKEDAPLRQIRRMEQLAGLDFISPRLTLSRSIWRLLNSAKRQIEWFKDSYPQRRPLDTWLIYFMAMLDSLKINSIKVMCRKFCFPRGDGKRILSYKNISLHLIWRLRQDRVKPQIIFELLEPLTYEVILLLKAKFTHQNFQRNIKDFFEIYNGMRILIRGHDLHKLGLRPGPYYQKIFTRVLQAKLSGQVKTREDELELIRRILKIK